MFENGELKLTVLLYMKKKYFFASIALELHIICFIVYTSIFIIFFLEETYGIRLRNKKREEKKIVVSSRNRHAEVEEWKGKRRDQKK